METQLVAVCCQNEGAENFILAGIGIFQLALMPRMPLRCVKESWIKSKMPALCKRKIDLGNYFLAAQLFKLQSSVGVGLFFYARLKAVQLLIV